MKGSFTRIIQVDVEVLKGSKSGRVRGPRTGVIIAMSGVESQRE
jgi:hypothetical protein